MLHTLVSTVDKDSADVLQRVIRETGHFILDRVFSPYPSPYEMSRALSTLRLDVVFLDMTYTGAAVSLVEQIRSVDALLPIVGFSTQASRPVPSLNLAGFMELPLSARNLVNTTRDVMRGRSRSNYSNVTAILPAKAGGGATTIATNAAAHLARSFGKKVLVVECDLQSGTIGERVGSRPLRSISETLESADVASTLIWPQHVFRKDDVDFLLTNRRMPIRPPAWHDYHHLLKFVANRYDHVILDLPDVVGDAASEALHAASSIYIMTTPELLSLSLVPQRLTELEAAQVDRSRVHILVNRWQAGDMSKADVAAMLGCKVTALFPNDYRAVNNAILNQSFVDSGTRLGKAYRSFAATLANEPDAPQTSLHLGLLLKPFRFTRPATVGNAHEFPSQERYAR
jgi:cellulose biosynthesis protein BcsQ